MTIVGVTGKKRHGKGTVASILVRDYGFQQIDFADALRSIMETLDPIVGMTRAGLDKYSLMVPVTYNEAINELGYELAKECYPEIVWLLQVMGTQIGREMIDPELWLKLWAERLETQRERNDVVVADIRFANEWEAVLSAQREVGRAYLIKVIRPGYIHDAEQDKHESEQGFRTPHSSPQLLVAKTVEEIEYTLHQIMEVWGIPRTQETKGAE